MRTLLALVVISAVACKGKSDDPGSSRSSRSSPDLPKITWQHPDCDLVMTKQIRERFGLVVARSEAVDRYEASSTRCATFRSLDKRSVSVHFTCSDSRVQRALDFGVKTSPEAIVVPNIGKLAYVTGGGGESGIYTVIDDDTECMVELQAHLDREHLGGQALLDLLGELPAVIAKQLSPATIRGEAEAELHARDANSWDKSPPVDCDKLVDAAARAAYPGGLTWSDEEPSRRSSEWECRRLHSGDEEVEVSVRCYRLRSSAHRLIEVHGGSMYDVGTGYPEAAGEAVHRGRSAALDRDTNCVVAVSAGHLPPDTFASTTRDFVHRMLANLTPALIGPFPKG